MLLWCLNKTVKTFESVDEIIKGIRRVRYIYILRAELRIIELLNERKLIYNTETIIISLNLYSNQHGTRFTVSRKNRKLFNTRKKGQESQQKTEKGTRETKIFKLTVLHRERVIAAY